MSTELDLEEKTEQAVIAYLKTALPLRGVAMIQGASDQPKTDGLIVVAATRGEQVGQNTGVFKLAVEISFSMHRKRGQNTSAKFVDRRTAISDLIQVDDFQLADNLTVCGGLNFHCYFAQLASVDKTPQEDKHFVRYTLELEAMPVSFATASLNT